MSDDLIWRLRFRARYPSVAKRTKELLLEAADELEKARTLVDDLAGSLRHSAGADMQTLVELARWDWLASHDDERLHAPGPTATPNVDTWGYDGPSACGLTPGDWHIPGFFTRMSVDRCTACCQKTGLPEGVGSPKNDEACRELVGLA